jgi:putative peptidoglycan lipid II flippase
VLAGKGWSKLIVPLIRQTVSLSERPAPACQIPRSLIRDTGVVSGFTLLAKLCGTAKAAAMASVFGSGHNLDNYLLAFLIPSFLADIFCGAIIPAAVPELVELMHRNDLPLLHSFCASLLRDSLRITLLVTILCATGGAIALLAWPSAGGVHSVSVLLFAMLPIIPCAAAANVWRAVLNARRSFALPAFTAVLAPAFVIGFILALGRTGGVRAVAFGTTSASAAEVIVLGLSVRDAGFPIFQNVASVHRPFTKLRQEYGFLVATAAVGGGTLFWGQFMASSLGEGSVSILNYGTRLAGVLLALGPAALSIAILPRFSQMAAEENWSALRRSLIRLLSTSMAISAGLALVLSACSSTIVRLTLQRGAFTAADTTAVAAVQTCSLLQMPFLVGITILMRTLAALKENRVVLPLFTATLFLNIGLGYILMRRFQVSGIALASCVGQSALFFGLLAGVFRHGDRYGLTVKCR